MKMSLRLELQQSDRKIVDDRPAEKITRAEWARARRNDNGRVWDGRRYIKRIDLTTGEVVWRPVEVIR